MQQLYFIRHGESQFNVQKRFAGRTNTPLTSDGRKQAKAAAKEIKEFGIDLIVSSPLSRALETAKIIAKEIGYPEKDIHINSLVIERDYGELEGKTYSPDLNFDGISDIETDDTLKERAALALRWLETLDAKKILVVSHGSFGRAFRFHLVDSIDFNHKIPNAQVEQWL